MPNHDELERYILDYIDGDKFPFVQLVEKEVLVPIIKKMPIQVISIFTDRKIKRK